MFIGQYTHAIDDKSRIVMPSKFRRDLTSKVYVSLDLDHCLSIYSEKDFTKVAQKYYELSDFDKKERALKRIFFSNSYESTCDGSGRVILPKPLVQKAGIVKDCVIVGNIDHVSVFAKESYDKMMLEDEESFETLAEQVANK